MKVNVQGGEAIFRNENGDTIIVPRNRRNEAMKYLLKDDHHSLDKLALDLPKVESYAVIRTQQILNQQNKTEKPRA